MRGVLPILAALTIAGCVDAPEAPADIETASTTDVAMLEPQLFEWSGHVIDSRLEGPTHIRPTEDALWPVFQEGILFSIDERPQAMEVQLAWEGAGEFMIMLHSHKEHGTNVYVEHISEMDDVNPKCIRVPTVDITEGAWQVMVHSDGAQSVDFTLGVLLQGGAGHIIEDDRHGHWPQDGGFEIDEHEIEPCTLAAPAAEPS